MHNQDLHRKYITLKKAGYRTPLGDLEYAVESIGLQLVEFDNNLITLSKYIKNVTHKAQNQLQEKLLMAWANSCHYGKMVKKYYSSIEFPEINNTDVADWMMVMAKNYAEEQVHVLITNALARRNCRMECNKEETAYHVISAYVNGDYTRRHDFVVFHILKYILYTTQAPEDTHSQLNYGRRASLHLIIAMGDQRS